MPQETKWKEVLKKIPRAAWYATVDLGKVTPWSAWILSFLKHVEDAVAKMPQEDRINAAIELSNTRLTEIEAEFSSCGVKADTTKHLLSVLFSTYFFVLENHRGELVDPEEIIKKIKDFENLPLRLRQEIELILLPIQENIGGIKNVINQIDQKIDNIPSIFKEKIRELQEKEDQEFEDQYLRQINIHHSKINSVGVRDLKELRQDLSLAYVSLSVKGVFKNTAKRKRAEEVLLENPLLTVRGPAGSGKSTLLSWTAITCARANNKSRWFGGVPFIIRLRELDTNDRGTPNVGKFVTYTVNQKLWPIEPPQNWIVNILKQKRAVVMIDGVDELSQQFRSFFWDWLNDFLNNYQGNRIIITSRYLPETKKDDWRVPKEFVSSELDDMTDSDIKQFILNWHNSVIDRENDPQIVVQLEDARDSLPAKIFDPSYSRVRDLCRTPLLCSMVCALHWREEGYIPRRRVELYDRCVSMLIEERDRKRGIEPPNETFKLMTHSDKEMVLQQLAFMMMRNVEPGNEIDYRIEIPRKQATTWVKNCIPLFEVPQARSLQASELLDYLLERSGLLREPIPGLIDFPHRSFQEYFAACAAGAQDATGELANHADDDRWHETIILAAGTKTGGIPFGRKLIEELLKRGERKTFFIEGNKILRHIYLALAIACLETAHNINPELQKRVWRHLPEIIPPKDRTMAKAVAAAGEIALKYLSYEKWRKEELEIITACARAVRLIGGNQAKNILLDYIQDNRIEVLVEAFNDPDINPLQAPAVLSFLKAKNKVQDFFTEFIKHIPSIPSLNGLKSLDLKYCINLIDISGLSSLNQLISLDLSMCRNITDITVLRSLTDLESLNLSGCKNITDISALSSLKKLKSLNVAGCKNITDIRPLSSLPKLESLSLSMCNKITELTPLSSLTQLVSLNLSGCPNITDIKELSSLSKLSWLSLQYSFNIKDITPLGFLPRLFSLNIAGCENITGIDNLINLPRLECLYIYRTQKNKIPNQLESLTYILEKWEVQEILAAVKDLF